MINNVMAKFADVKKGLYDTQYEISGKPPTQNIHTTEEPRQAISLIDLDDNPITSTGSNSPATSSNVLSDLSDLFGSSASVSTAPLPLAPTSSLSSSSVQPQSNDLFDLFGDQPTTTTTVQKTMSSPLVQNTMTLPSIQKSSPSLPSINLILLVNKNGLRIELENQQLDNGYKMKAYFSNQSTAPMEKLKLQLAVPKSMQIKMEPQSSQIIPPKSEKTVTQGILLNNPSKVR